MDLSLEALAADGRPQARPLLLLLSCFAAATDIPAILLQPGPVACLLSPGMIGSVPDDCGRLLRYGMSGLAAVGLIELGTGIAASAPSGIMLHPVVADVNRVRLLTSPGDDLTRVISVAIDLIRAVTASLDYKKPADWPAWKQIVPHMTAMLGWCAARIDTVLLAALLEVSDPAGDALWRSGDHVDAERLAQLMVNAAARLGDDHPASLIARNARNSIPRWGVSFVSSTGCAPAGMTRNTRRQIRPRSPLPTSVRTRRQPRASSTSPPGSWMKCPRCESARKAAYCTVRRRHGWCWRDRHTARVTALLGRPAIH